MRGEKVLLFAILCFVLLLPTLRAQQVQPQPYDWESNVTSSFFSYECKAPTTTYWEQWMPLAFLALLISIFIIGGAYMLSMGFELHRAHIWAKNELYQTFGTAVIVIILAAGIPLAEGVGKSISYMDKPYNPSDHSTFDNDGNTSIEMALGYSRTVANLMLVNFAGLTLVNGVVTLFGSLPISMAPGGIAGATFSLEPIVRPVLHFIGIMVTLMVTVMGEWQAHWFVLCFISQRMLSLFLPLGILLRAFPVTRWAGGFLIALALGFYFIYPLMININEAIGIPSVVKDMAGIIDKFLTEGIWQIGLLAFALRFFSFSTYVVFIFGIVTFLMYNFVPAVVYSVVVLGMILPIFNIFITFTFVKELSKILGADVNLAAIMKMI